MENDQLILTREAAQMLSVADSMVIWLANKGRLPCIRAGNRCIRLFRKADVQRLAAERAEKKMRGAVNRGRKPDSTL
jgi:hypothetical protein